MLQTPLVLQSDGKIVLTGFVESGTERDIALVRYNTDGTLDTTFGGGDGIVTTDFGTAQDEAFDIVQQPLDGKLVVVGKSSTATVVLRYNTDGSLDTSFASGGVYEVGLGTNTEEATSISIDGDGKIVVVGSATSGIDSQAFVLRLNADGTRDTSFDVDQNNGPTYTEDGPAVILDADVEIFDAELSDVDNFDGSSLTLTRDGGANSEDVLSFENGPVISLSGGELFKNSAVIASFNTTTTSGQLVITFTDANGETPTNDDVNAIMQQIAYSNTNQSPPASVLIDWTFSDNNDGSQGSGGVLTANRQHHSQHNCR